MRARRPAEHPPHGFWSAFCNGAGALPAVKAPFHLRPFAASAARARRGLRAAG